MVTMVIEGQFIGKVPTRKGLLKNQIVARQAWRAILTEKTVVGGGGDGL